MQLKGSLLSVWFNINKVLFSFFKCCLSNVTVLISKLSLLPQLRLIFLLLVNETLQKAEEIGFDNFISILFISALFISSVWSISLFVIPFTILKVPS